MNVAATAPPGDDWRRGDTALVEAFSATDAVMPPMDELVRLFAGYGCEILGPPLSLSDLS